MLHKQCHPCMHKGLQGRHLEGEGVVSASLGRIIMAMLQMDGTALAARSKVGLQSLTEKYIQRKCSG